jgi:hypothetical protein
MVLLGIEALVILVNGCGSVTGASQANVILTLGHKREIVKIWHAICSVGIVR